jgi:hypothetical protein
MQIMHKQHTEELALMRQQLSQLAYDNKQLLCNLLPKREAAAAECSNFAAETSDTLHEQIDQRAQCTQDAIPVLARDEVLDTVFSFIGIGDYNYAAGVCRNWRGRYMKLYCSTAAGADCTGMACKLCRTPTVCFHCR